jgi:Ca2+-binding EF-hand superfamily protein
MTIMKKLIMCAAVAGLFSGAAGAEGFMPWTDVFAKADTNGDGGVSMEEVMDHKIGEDFAGFQPWMQDHFAALDTNGDGIVMRDELEAGMKSMSMNDEALSRAFFENTGFMPKSN